MMKNSEKNQNELSFCPLYKKLAAVISDRILKDGLRSGDFFCTLGELCKEYRASITTVRKAVALLTAQGFVASKSGEGIIVGDVMLLRRTASMDRRVLILHHHFRKRLNDYFELRLSALSQGLFANDMAPQVIYREALDDEKALAFYWKSSAGIICGNAQAHDVLNACQTYGMRQVLVINPPANLVFPPNFHPVYYDFSGLVRQSCDFFQRRPHRKIIMLRNDPDIVPPPDIEVIDLKEAPSVELGRAYGARLLNEPDAGFWATDDFVGLGLYDFFRGRGVDLNRTGRLLVNSSPSRVLTDELGIATIGFCPMHVGEAAAAYFARILKTPETPCGPLIIEAEANQSASGDAATPYPSTGSGPLPAPQKI